VVVAGVVNVTLVAWLAERFQEFAAESVMTASVDRMPVVEAALVLGTSKLLPNGSANLTFDYRLDAAAMLWKAGKARYLIVSGNHTGDYDEPSDMRAGLIARGVPGKVIYRDGRGFRTWDSVVRARKVFGLERLAIVSQRDHVARALFIARNLGMQAVGFEAEDEDDLPLKMRIRPYLAAVLSYYDAWQGLLPHHIGPRVAIGIDPAK
jgi:SanA protein